MSDLFTPVVRETETEDTLDFITAQGVLTTLTSFLDATGTGILDMNRSLVGDNTMAIEDT